MTAKLSLDQIKADVDAYAIVSRRLAHADAAFEETVTTQRTAHERATAADRESAKAIADRVLAWCRRNPQALAEPVVTTHAAFGLRSSTVLAIDPDREQDILDYLRRHDWRDCIKPPVAETLVKPAIKNRLDRGETIPHCTLNTKRQAYIDLVDALDPTP